MKHSISKDPFETAFEESPSPPDSPIETKPYPISLPTQTHQQLNNRVKTLTITNTNYNEEEQYEEEEEDEMDAEFSKFRSASIGDPHKIARLQNVFSQFTEEQLSRYESFRRAAFQKATMRRVIASIAGTQSISKPVLVVVSGITKMFVGEVVERARIIMTERKESGPIRPCHLREAHRRLKLEGKVFKRKVPRLFR
ncbi:transcription initiation factor TFIID subunit 11-like [Vicia villosa]|uniref:transcription initiation factor TFIID subunit 11-like n=1 Tax=Vicia villosa TaxID=3911 RepID=UPI00273C5B61|nr:transcription initiation factor TFIID subunit 11-like [Vicia villosa]